MNEGPEWFAPKRYGWGAGLPISWQGWLLSAVFVGLVFAATLLLPGRPLAFLAIVLPAAALFVIISARTTRGGWRWRWGKED